MRSYAVGDVHGHLGLLVEAHRRVARDREATGDREAPVIHLGDLVDRGPDSAGVVGHLAGGMARGEPWQVLLGNHDRMFLRFVGDPGWQDPGLREGIGWLDPRLGGMATLASYGLDFGRLGSVEQIREAARRAVPAAHLAFLAARPTSLARGGALFVHAGIRPGVALAEQVEDDLVWIRHPFLDDRRDHGLLVVHGHTAIDRARHYGNRVNLDSSAAYGGPLTVAVIEDGAVHVLAEDGRRPLTPGPDDR
jgi:serine/threonine protein phosphatase 1